jgi:CheY-like chemotaxis protein
MAQNDIRHRAHLSTSLAQVPNVDANASRLGQVVLNLIVNAVQALREGDVASSEIGVSVFRAASGEVVIEVRDTGEGIPPAILGHIFDPFFTTKPPGVGTGLGLAICHGLVKAMNGHITVESAPGRGSTFRVFLPASQAGAAAAEEAAAPVRSSERLRVLVVDDERSIGTSLKILLRDDHDVEAVTRAADALERLSGGAAYDVILCDLMMPEMSGMAFYDAVHALWPALAPRVVFLTGGAFTAASRDFLERVPNPRLEKPFETRRLYEVMHAVRTA